MVTLKCIGKAIVVTATLGLGVVLVLGALVAAGVPPLLVAVGWGVVAAVAYHQVAQDFGSENAGLWAAAGFLFGLVPLPFLAYCAEHERMLSADRAVGPQLTAPERPDVARDAALAPTDYQAA
jgi:hypothetical protein